MTKFIKNNSTETNHNGRIKITSGEQFVPLYLTQYYCKQLKLANHYRTEHMFKSYLEENSNSKVTAKLKIQLEKKLKNSYQHLNLDVPKEYSFTPAIKINTEGIHGLMNLYEKVKDHNYWCNSVFYVNHYYQADCGLMVKLDTNVHHFFKDGNYYLDHHIKFVNHITPLMLIVVKAKHLKILRATLSLNISNKVEIPLSDIKMLVSAEGKADSVCVNLVDYFKKSIPTEITDSQTILNYLMKPEITNKTKEQVLADAITVMEDEAGVYDCVV